MFKAVSRARRGKPDVFATVKMIDDKLRVGRDGVEANLAAKATAGNVRKARGNVLRMHCRNFRVDIGPHYAVGVDRGLVLLGGNLHSSLRPIDCREAVQHVVGLWPGDPDKDRKSIRGVTVRMLCYGK